ncbi:MAG: hypothetical protein ACRCXX_14015 [Cetobacterium sp.]|uniref:hypothetical protein n=1 Tax=Cetobacterium sp. TaxID=2071632 RepID=UPI003F37D4F0
MRNLKDLLNEGKSKNEKYYVAGRNMDNLVNEHKSNILNMRTVQEGTATAGSFCNKVMEIASNVGLNMVDTRVISDIFQRIALDSKHDGTGDGYKSSDWYKIAELFIMSRRAVTRDVMRKELLAILTGNTTEISTSQDNNDLVDVDDFI